MSNEFAHIAYPSAWIPRCEDLMPGVPCLSVAEFLARRESKEWLVVDCRGRRQRAVSVLPGAVSLNQFRALRAGKQWLFYCTVGRRSGAHVRRLARRGLPAFCLAGGVLAWAAAEQPFVTLDGQPTRRVHVHGYLKDALAPEYQAVGGK